MSASQVGTALPQVVVLERNKLLARRAARVLSAAGAAPIMCETPAEANERAPSATLLFADAFDVEEVRATLARNARLRGVLWTAEPFERVVRHLTDEPRISNVLGRESFEVLPRAWELLAICRRLFGAPAQPFSSLLSWGATVHELAVGTTAGRDRAVADIGRFVEQAGAPKRLAEMLAEVAHELLMNAMYDAPVDRNGRAPYAHDRKADITLPREATPILRWGTDGLRVALQVEDPFGRLRREHVFNGLARGMRGGEMDRSQGGAGLGMIKIHQASVALLFEVDPGRSTRVSSLFELDLNLRELQKAARSLHYFESAPRGARA